MIKSLRIRNFRCFRDVRVDFEPLTVLVGPNGSGKSTLLDALATLARLTRAPLTNRDGGEFFFGRPGWHGSAAFEHAVFCHQLAEDITFEAELEGNEGGRGRYLLAIGRRDGRLMVVDEKLWWQDRLQTVDLDLASTPVELPSKSGPISLSVPHDATLPFRVFPLRHELPDHPVVRAGLAIQSALGPSHIHEFVPSRLASPSSYINTLRSDGHGLVVALEETLGNDREAFRHIETNLSKLFPEVTKLLVRPFPRKRGEKELVIRTRGPLGDIDVPASMAPSGILVVIAILWIMYGSHYSVLGLDEIEVHLHPWLLGKVMKMINDLAVPPTGPTANGACQVVLATHSPEVLNTLEGLDPVRICERDATGAVQIVAPGSSKENCDKLRDLFQNAVGSMWFSGHLGGVPIDLE